MWWNIQLLMKVLSIWTTRLLNLQNPYPVYDRLSSLSKFPFQGKVFKWYEEKRPIYSGSPISAPSHLMRDFQVQTWSRHFPGGSRAVKGYQMVGYQKLGCQMDPPTVDPASWCPKENSASLLPFLIASPSFCLLPHRILMFINNLVIQIKHCNISTPLCIR